MSMMFAHEALPDSAASLREQIRAFLADERRQGGFEPACEGWMVANPAWSRKLGAAGWLGMTWPKRYGGGERSALERYVVTEELLAAGAPVGAHWVADRQTGPMLLRYGTEEQRMTFLPAMARGECYFALGLSEPDAGSDLAAVRTRATPVDGGWQLSGRKIWTSFAIYADHIMVLCRSAPRDEDDRHAGLSQLLVPLDAPGVEMRAIRNLAGEEHFAEVVFDEVFVPDKRVVGEVGNGWRQIIGELAFERSGPERFLSYYPLLVALLGATGSGAADPSCAEAVGALVTHLATLRQMSLSVAGRLQAGQMPEIEAALVKDLGTRFEQLLPEEIRRLAIRSGIDLDQGEFGRLLRAAILHAPSATLRGGTNEILRGAVARGLGLR